MLRESCADRMLRSPHPLCSPAQGAARYFGLAAFSRALGFNMRIGAPRK